MQIPKITPIVIGIFIVTFCLLAAGIYYNVRNKDGEPDTMMTYVYCIVPAALLAILVVFGYDRYYPKKCELLQEGFYA
jgi:branched-subunit amino acid transport protein AzlD